MLEQSFWSQLTWRRVAVGIEWVFALLVLVGIGILVYQVRVDGYLHDPFLHSKSETFTDWYNPAYWVYNQGTYSVWQSIYPPFSFVFIWLFSNSSCYKLSPDGRYCDPGGIILVSVLTFVNFALAWMTFHKIDKSTALPRAIAVSLGMPAIFAWERGNLIVPCFTAYILAHGNLLKSARMRTFFAALTLNFKPYLLLTLAGRMAKRQWVWMEWCALWFLLVYGVSYLLFGAGDPFELIRNTSGFEHSAGIDLVGFTTTYNAFLTILKLPLPLTAILGSRTIEWMETIFPLLIHTGIAAALPCIAYAVLRPQICSHGLISALVLLLFMSISTAAGGYALHFALFLLMLERWRGVTGMMVVLMTYLWCIPIDTPMLSIYHDYGYSFLGHQNVSYDLLLTYGQLLRPGFMLIMEYALIFVIAGKALRDIFQLYRSHAEALSQKNLA